MNNIICYRANISPSLAIPREPASYVTLQHFPLWQSLMNGIIMLPCNISPLWQSLVNEHHNIVTVQHFPLWQSLMNSIICYRATFPSLAIPHEQHNMLPCNISLWQSLVNENHMLPCNISPLWQSLVNEHHMLPCNISPLWQSLVNSIIWYCATFPLSQQHMMLFMRDYKRGEMCAR